MVLLLMFSALAALAIVATIVVALRDGYRRIPTRPAQPTSRPLFVHER